MNAVSKALWNPIVAKEYRTRMRTWRSPFAITLYILLLGGLGWAAFSLIVASSSQAFGVGSGSNYGQMLFTFLIIFQVALLGFITPALTAGSISGERERQTIDLLFVTPISPFSIIWGKLLASMSFIILLLVLSIPIFSLVFLFGGIELDQVAYAFAVTGATALTLGFIGIAFSTLFRRTLTATVAAYAAAFVLFVGFFAYGYVFPTEADPSVAIAPAPPAVTLISPVVPLLTVASNQPVQGYGFRYKDGSQGASSKGAPAQAGFCAPTVNGGVTCSSAVYQFTSATGTTLPSGLFAGWQYWQASIVMQLLICAIALLFSALVLPPVRRFRPWRRRAAATAAA